MPLITLILYLAKALTILMLLTSWGIGTSPSIPFLNNSDNIFFCLGAEASFKLNHVVPNQVCGNPFSLSLFLSIALKWRNANGLVSVAILMKESLFWCWWLDRQLFNRSFVYISFKLTSILKGRTKLTFLALHSITSWSLLNIFPYAVLVTGASDIKI